MAKLRYRLRQVHYVRQDPRRRGRIVAGLVTVDPDPLDAEPPRRCDVVEPAAGAMDPVAPLDAALLLETLEMAELRLVAADHLRGDDEIGLQRKLGERLGEEIVVAIREHGELPARIAQRAQPRRDVAIERQLAPVPDDRV